MATGIRSCNHFELQFDASEETLHLQADLFYIFRTLELLIVFSIWIKTHKQ